MKINVEKARWSRRYKAALRKYLKQGREASVQPALLLGRKAASLRVKTLELALIHEQTLLALLSHGSSSRARTRMIERAKSFFAETIAPIEETHHAALKAYIHVNQLARILRRRTAESSISIRNLKRGIAQRQASEAALKKSGRKHTTLLAEAHRLQKHLQHLTQEILSTQENARHKISHRLHDEIAQTLLAINLRLLILNNVAKANTKSLKKEIANTQQLVRKLTYGIQVNV